ncbi:MAG: ABC transporter ATP-binding protein [Acidimicrobiales bacterium]
MIDTAGRLSAPTEPVPAADAGPLLAVRDLRVFFPETGSLARLLGRTRGVRAVDGVDLDVRPSEIVGVVGESGSGKTTLALAALSLIRPTGGQVRFRSEDATGLRGAALRRFRRHAVMIFQDPHSSLSPRMRVSALLTEPYAIHAIPPEKRTSVADLLDLVELPQRLGDYYPHELSGGQARRVGIARALALRPALIVADEPTAGLDVSAASAILNLLRALQRDHGTAYLIITHALNVVGYLADRVAVMYLGRVVETGPADQIYDQPLHPYTRALIASIPEMGQHPRRAGIVAGEIPSPRNPPSGCHFHPRCPFAVERCWTEDPETQEAAPGRTVACHRWQDIGAEPVAEERGG